MARLQAGVAGVYSYNGTCPHQGADRFLRCTCPKMLNVLRNGRMVRYVNGEARPVLSQTEFLTTQPPQPPPARPRFAVGDKVVVHPRRRRGAVIAVYPVRGGAVYLVRLDADGRDNLTTAATAATTSSPISVV